MKNLRKYTIYFLIYSVLGALAETLFRLVTEGHLYGIHGYLYMPLMPIYGFGSLAIILISRKVRKLVPLFFVTIIVTTILEFVVHWLIEMLLGIRIWDYSDKPFQFQGRISLDNSLGFGVAAIALVYLIHPRMKKLVAKMSPHALTIAALLIWVAVIADTIVSTISRLQG